MAHLLKWPKPGTLKTLNAGKEVEQQEVSLMDGENEKWYSHFERQFGCFLQS